MKRKRGHKKGKPKGTPVVIATETPSNASSENKEERSGLNELVNDKYESGMEVDTPSSTGTDQPYNLANVNPDGSIDKAVGKSVGRVKVKLRTSKKLDSQPTSSDVPTQSDTDKSSQQQGFERHSVITERMEDSANSLPEVKVYVASKRAGSIKIKSSKALGASNSVPALGGSGNAKESKSQQDSRNNKQELEAALTVVKKVMKMDAAEPFNVPVNPDALGIPDYFDVIDTPMDFGTICNNLERNEKYMNSEDVFKDVQYIWDNCYKYNNKGDYILDLMRRVKKNFMKYWTAAGLYTEQLRGAKGVERSQAEDVGQSGQGKVMKSGQSKQKTRKGHGRRHKHDCLCAICVLKRRRREREENDRIAKGNVGVGHNNVAKESKEEESLLVASPCGEDSSSNMDESLSPDADAEDEENEEEVKLQDREKQRSPSEEKHDNGDDDDDDQEEEEEDNEDEDEDENEKSSQKKGESETSEKLQFHDGSEEPNRQTTPSTVEKTRAQDGTVPKEEGITEQQEGLSTEIQQQKHKESFDKHHKAKLLENYSYENPLLLGLCGVLFPNNSKSAWNGPHSLHQHQHKSSRTSSIHAAVEAIMK
ncbi:bromodomain-containing factor 2 [Quillaja saponaria]|nr:bromodomain-containing factor 2 [Quillaja saponaria]